MVNEHIRFKEVLVIGPNGEQLGVLSKRDALERAYSYDLDLFCVAANANPPVCKILDYGRYRFEKQKAAKEAKRNQHVTEIKPLRLSPVIDTHDFETKVRHARKWLADNMKVKIDMRFRGRMMDRQEVGKKILNQFIEQVSDLGTVEKQPALEGNIMSLIIGPKKNK
ncbi:MAG: translation initiation factor IF-3 [Erysipelotrichaceae bacterium]|jgi:translation initiation factor IF-3|nr:translation initiation factor IF-3 [Erysipelotrichaceae bacterium]